MDIKLIFVTQFILSIVVVALLARWYAAPWLKEKSFEVALMALIVPHAFRHVGLSFIVPALNEPGMPMEFARIAAYGDFISAILALGVLIALKGRWLIAKPLVWVFSIVGIADLANALSQSDAIMYMGATWFIPTFFVPVLLVTHVMVIALLLRNLKGLPFSDGGGRGQA